MKRFNMNIQYVAAATLTALIPLWGCRGGSDKRDTEGMDSLSVTELSLELPAIPSTISEPEDQAGYLAIHFWDNLDFNDPDKAQNIEFMEQNFVDYLSIFPAVMATDRPRAFGRLLERAAANPKVEVMIRSLGKKYLNHPDSPMYNEEYYADFIKAVKRISNRQTQQPKP